MTTIQQRSNNLSIATDFSESVSPLLQRIYRARGASCDNDVNYQLRSLEMPTSLKGLTAAVSLLARAMREQQRVLIVGDFDADGATSCALSILALKAMGLQQVNFLVPNRFEYGYGLTPEIVEVAKAYRPDLIVTVDNGIASVDGVAYAKSLGCSVIVTDHHLPPKILPEADAIVNPNQQGCDFSSKNLAGVGVIFYLLSALRSRLRELNWFVEQAIVEPNMASYLDLVALGTVADVVPLDRNNRTLVHQGIQRVKAGKARPGILALLEVAGKNYQRLTSQDFGFIVGPRLNAAGRLDDISLGIQCLLTDNVALARELAAQMDGLNRERRSIEASMQAEALASLNSLTLDETELPWGLCLLEDNWHQGVVGILASRIKEKYHRPVIAFAEVDDDTIKCSARSIPGLHIRDALDMIATQNPEILQKFGGHAMAAGLSLERKNFTRFAQLFDQVVRGLLTQDLLQEILLTDGELTTREISLHNAHALAAAGPWGQQFPEPIFNGCFNLISQRIVGEKHLKMTLGFLDDPQKVIDAIAFNIDVDCWPNADVRQIDVVYQLSINEFRGEQTEQLMIRHIKAI